MPNAIKLTLYENDKIFDTIENVTSTDTPNLIKSIEEFRLKVNETLSKIIEDDGQFDDYVEDDISSEEDQSTSCVTPKKRKK
ncbi:unnamed protein product, partial [Brenthis ino]